jgi:hypothetical protein
MTSWNNLKAALQKQRLKVDVVYDDRTHSTSTLVVMFATYYVVFDDCPLTTLSNWRVQGNYYAVPAE